MKQNIDLGLALLQTKLRPGVALTQEDIAAWCDCNPGRIGQIERAALAKIKRILSSGRQTDAHLAELVEEYLYLTARHDRVFEP